MTEIRVVVAGELVRTPFGRGIRMLLSDDERFDVVELDSEHDIASMVDSRVPTTLVLAGTQPTDLEELLGSTPNLSAIVLDPSAARALVVVDNPDGRRLRRLIEVLADATLAGEVPPDDRLRIVRPNDFARADRGAGANDISALRRWLDLTYGIPLMEREILHSGTSVPGWSLSPSDALRGLQIDEGAALEEIRGQWVKADDELMQQRRGLPDTLSRLSSLLGLTDHELRLVVLVLAPEIDGAFGLATGVLLDDLTEKRPTLTLLAELLGLPDGAWDLRRSLARVHSLTHRDILVGVAGGAAPPTVDTGLRVNPAIVASLVCTEIGDAARSVGADVLMPRELQLTAAEQQLAQQVSPSASRDYSTLVDIRGDGTQWFERILSGSGLAFLRGDLREPSSSDFQGIASTISQWALLAALSGRGLVLTGSEALDETQSTSLVRALATVEVKPSFLALGGPTDWGLGATTVVHPPRVSSADRAAALLAASDHAGASLTEVDALALGSALQLDLAEIEECVARCTSDENETPLPLLIRRAAGELKNGALPPAVRRLHTSFSWDDLVLDADIKAVLQTLPHHLSHASQVLDDWGFSARIPYGQGVTALFGGPSGTGKTMAAQVIAAELGMDLLQVELSKTVSKYIGDTEKNIDRVFTAAERFGAVLLFDEADALFGKRSEVKDAHDRHANVEVAYLLQRMETFRGVAVLTTNLKQNIDQAFLRRLRYVVDFPLPDSKERQAIWGRAFPANAPLGQDIDLAFLARRLKLAGGNIQQIAVHAAFTAAAEGRPIGMSHIVAATRGELAKLGMDNAEKSLEDRYAKAS